MILWKHFCIAKIYTHNYLSYCFAFFNLFPPVYLCFLVFTCKVFSLRREISLWQYNQPSRKYSGFFHMAREETRVHVLTSHRWQPGALPRSAHRLTHSRSSWQGVLTLRSSVWQWVPTGFTAWHTWLWLCSSCVPCWEYHKTPSCPAQPFTNPAQPCGSSQVCYWHSLPIRPLSRSQPTFTDSIFF